MTMGNKSWRNRLTEKQQAKILELNDVHKIPQKQIAYRYGISAQAVNTIARNQRAKKLKVENGEDHAHMA